MDRKMEYDETIHQTIPMEYVFSLQMMLPSIISRHILTMLTEYISTVHIMVLSTILQGMVMIISESTFLPIQ